MSNEKILEIERLSHDGRGVAHDNGKTIFVFNALPQEKVSYRIIRKHRQYDDAVSEKIYNATENRIAARCPHFGTCGGCVLQHLSSENQIDFKQSILLEQLTHFAKLKPENILAPLSANPWGYRHRARLSVRHVNKKNKTLIGFHELDGRYVADLQSCAVLHPKIGEHLADLSEILQKLSNPYAIAQVEVAIGENDQALVFRNLENLNQEDKELLINFGRNFSFSIYLHENDHQLKKIHENSDEPLKYHLPEFNLTYQFEPEDFVQINFAMNRLMVQQAIKLLAPTAKDSILDFFCGAGNFSLALAKFARHVIGIEGEKSLIEKAQKNVKKNQIENCEFELANLANSESIDALMHRLRQSKPNKVLLDPPRSGAEALLPSIISIKPLKILYISCNPATLARDAKTLTQKHYQLTDAGVMDMFPQTKHVEAMALFTLK